MKLNDAMCDAEFAQLPIEVKRAIINIEMEYRAAIKKHPKWPSNIVESAAIVGEESGELLRAALNFRNEKGRFYEMHKEAIQTAAMALRFLVEYGIDPIQSEIEKIRKA